VPEVMEGRFYESRLAGGFAGSSYRSALLMA
jgi:hypothetical protein